MNERAKARFRAGERVRVIESRKAEYLGEAGTVAGMHRGAAPVGKETEGRIEVYVDLDNGVRGKFLERQLEPLHYQLSFDDLTDSNPS